MTLAGGKYQGALSSPRDGRNVLIDEAWVSKNANIAVLNSGSLFLCTYPRSTRYSAINVPHRYSISSQRGPILTDC